MTDNARIDEAKLAEQLRAIIAGPNPALTAAQRDYIASAAAYLSAPVRRSIQEQPEAVGKDQIPRKQQADAYLEALLGYSGGFYGAAIKAGLPAAETVGPVAHIERAARELHRLAVASAPPPIAGAGWKGDPLTDKYPRQDEVEKVIIRRLYAKEIEGYTLTMAHEIAALFVPDNTDARAAQGHVEIEYDGFAGDIIGNYRTRDGKIGVVVQQDGTRVVHVYGRKWIEGQVAAIIPGTDASGVIEQCAAVADRLIAKIDGVMDGGKGTYGQSDYITDDTWARWLGKRSAAADISGEIRALDPVKAPKP